MATRKMPVMRADKVYGHASPDHEHDRDSMRRETPAGSKTAQPQSQPPSRAKQRRKQPKSAMPGEVAMRPAKGRLGGRRSGP